LVAAYRQLKNSNLDLVIVGSKGWDTMGLQSINRLESVKDNIKYLDYIENYELYALYTSSKLFIMPSLWEGFGYPVIEAMKLGSPVATSNISSLAEIAKDSALLFNPNEVKDIAKSIDQLSVDEKLRQSLIKKGLERGKIFTWEGYYKKMLTALTHQV
jgi:glycosyltransferase involved in cell wall biosynthesis